MNLNRQSVWTEERIKELTRLQSEGWPYSQIAETLGGGLTRNACIGKAKRMGLPMRKTDSRSADQITRARTRNRSPEEQRQYRRTRLQLRPELSIDDDQFVSPVSALSPDDIPLAQRKTFAQLQDHHCHFPYGDVGQPDFFFCGADVQHDSPYCPSHARVTHQRGSGRPWDEQRGRRQYRQALAMRLAAETARVLEL